MHKSSQQNMARLIQRYAPLLGTEPRKRVLDVGSSSLNGAYRPLFAADVWSYFGLDVAAGPNVDIVAEDPYSWPIEDGTFDLVVSGQTLEHVEFFWVTALEMRRVLRPGGLAFLIVPSRGPQHRHPVDCWRFYPDSFAALARWAGMELLWINNPWEIDESLDFQAMWEWGDCVGVLRVPEGASNSHLASLKAALQPYIRSATSSVIPDTAVRIPKSKKSYLSTKSMLRFRIRKHMRSKAGG